MKIIEYINIIRLRHFEKTVKKYKPKLLDSWEKEFNNEFEKLDDEIFRLKKVIADERHNAEYWHGKYDALDKVYNGVKDNIIKKVEDNAMKAGEQKEQIRNLKNDLKERREL